MLSWVHLSDKNHYWATGMIADGGNGSNLGAAPHFFRRAEAEKK
jgi:hypothetical protein